MRLRESFVASLAGIEMFLELPAFNEAIDISNILLGFGLVNVIRFSLGEVFDKIVKARLVSMQSIVFLKYELVEGAQKHPRSLLVVDAVVVV